MKCQHISNFLLDDIWLLAYWNAQIWHESQSLIVNKSSFNIALEEGVGTDVTEICGDAFRSVVKQ